MPEFIKVATISEIGDPGKQMLEVDERLVVLFHAAGQFYCMDDVCTHDGGPLADGEMCGHEIRCPRHGARFDIRSGQALSMPATEPVTVHEVKVVGDDIYVQLNEE